MKKFGVLVFVFLVGISALGQQIGGSPVFQPKKTISLEDETTGNYFVFSPTTGEYQFTRCGVGLILKGKGLVKIDGCNIYLEDVQDELRVLVSINQCDQQGKAAIERVPSFSPQQDVQPISEYLVDNNMRDNSLTCTKR